MSIRFFLRRENRSEEIEGEMLKMSRRCPEGIPTIFTGLKRKSRWESVAVEGMARVKEPRSFLDCGTSSLRLGCWVLNCIGLDGVGRKRGRGEEGMGREPSVRMTPGLLKCRRSLSWDTGAGWSNRAGKVAYESRRDYIIAVKGDTSTSYLKYPERVGGISTNLVDFVEWRFVVWRCP